MKIKTLNGFVSVSKPHRSILTSSLSRVVSITYTPNDMEGWGVTKEIDTGVIVDTEYAIAMEIECERFL